MVDLEILDFNVLNHSNSIRNGSNHDQVFLDVDITPNSAQPGLTGYNRWRDRLMFKIRSQARKGKANNELLLLLSDLLNVDSKNLNIIKGEHSTQKTIELRGLDRGQVIQRIFEALNE
ncbi:DUF167 family protein [[Eubacterium] cellulosolvens]